MSLKNLKNKVAKALREDYHLQSVIADFKSLVKAFKTKNFKSLF
jgi:hypothetical protein